MKLLISVLFTFLLLLNSCAGNRTNISDNNKDTTDQYNKLHDIWALMEIDGKQIDFQTEAPNLEFHISDKKMFGYSGCNRIQGSIEVSKSTIKFGPTAATRMACPDLDLEHKFLSLISDQEVSYSIKDLQLTLESPDGTLLFKKVD